jgi:hypothetical protein
MMMMMMLGLRPYVCLQMPSWQDEQIICDMACHHPINCLICIPKPPS